MPTSVRIRLCAPKHGVVGNWKSHRENDAETFDKVATTETDYILERGHSKYHDSLTLVRIRGHPTKFKQEKIHVSVSEK